MPETTTRERGEIVELRKRLEQREAMAAVKATYRKRRADRRARTRQAAIRRRATLAGEMARTRAEVDQSGEARTQRVAGTRTLALCLLLPVMIAFGAWSAAGVQAGMVAMLGLDPASPAAAMAWAVEPALLGIVAGVILIRARLQSAGGDLDERATKVEFGALAISIILNMAGHWPPELSGAAVAALAGHALGPIGAAGAAYLIAVVQDGVRDADPWTLADGTRAPSLASAPEVEEGDSEEDEGRAQERLRLLAKGEEAVAAIAEWQARDRAQETRTRMRAQSMAAAAGGAPRALPTSVRAHADQGFAHSERVPAAREHTPTDMITERVDGAAARRAQGAVTRAAIVEHASRHPEHTAEQIAAHVGVHPSTVRRHQATMRAQEHATA